MSKMHLKPQSDCEVGYGKPPKGAKTKRPKGFEERLENIFYEEGYRDITVQGEHGMISMSMAQAAIRSLSVKAVKGDSRSLKLFIEVLKANEQSDFELYREHQDT